MHIRRGSELYKLHCEGAPKPDPDHGWGGDGDGAPDTVPTASHPEEGALPRLPFSPSSPAMPHFICQHSYPGPKSFLPSSRPHTTLSQSLFLWGRFLWSLHCLPEPPAATKCPSCWLSVYRTQMTHVDSTASVSMGQDTAGNLPPGDSRLGQA